MTSLFLTGGERQRKLQTITYPLVVFCPVLRYFIIANIYDGFVWGYLIFIIFYKLNYKLYLSKNTSMIPNKYQIPEMKRNLDEKLIKLTDYLNNLPNFTPPSFCYKLLGGFPKP